MLSKLVLCLNNTCRFRIEYAKNHWDSIMQTEKFMTQKERKTKKGQVGEQLEKQLQKDS